MTKAVYLVDKVDKMYLYSGRPLISTAEPVLVTDNHVTAFQAAKRFQNSIVTEMEIGKVYEPGIGGARHWIFKDGKKQRNRDVQVIKELDASTTQIT